MPSFSAQRVRYGSEAVIAIIARHVGLGSRADLAFDVFIVRYGSRADIAADQERATRRLRQRAKISNYSMVEPPIGGRFLIIDSLSPISG